MFHRLTLQNSFCGIQSEVIAIINISLSSLLNSISGGSQLWWYCQSQDSARKSLHLCKNFGPLSVIYSICSCTDKPGYNDVVFAQDVYHYTANIVIAMIIIVRITKVLRRSYIVIWRISNQYHYITRL